MGNCFGKRLKGPQYGVSERRMEVDGKKNPEPDNFHYEQDPQEA